MRFLQVDLYNYLNLPHSNSFFLKYSLSSFKFISDEYALFLSKLIASFLEI